MTTPEPSSSRPKENSLDLTEIIMLIIEQQDGRIILPREFIEKADFAGKVIAIDFDHVGHQVVLTIQNEEDVVYESGV